MSIGSIMNGVNSSLRNYNVSHTSQSNSIQKIASGSKYPSAAFGPASYAIIQRTYSNIGAVQQANTNAQNTNAMLSTAAGAASNSVSMLSSLRSTILEAANDTNGTTDLAALQGTVNQTIAGLDDNVSSATYNGMRLVDGSKTVAVQGAYGYTNVNLGDFTSQGLGLTDSQGNSTINLTDKSSLSSALDTVDKALNSALDQSTSLGAAQQGLGYQSANLTTQEENLYASVSTEGDTDIASEATKLASSNTQSQVALWAIKQGMSTLSQQTLGALNNHSRGAAYSMLM
jgi:flagellin